MSRIGHDVIGSVAKSLGITPQSRYEKWWKSKGKRIYDRLSKKEVKNVTFDGRTIWLEFDGKILENNVVIVPTEKWVGSWNRTKSEVYIDNDVPAELVPSLAVHETVEKYVKEKYGLNENSHGHELSELIESKWFIPKFGKGKWSEYETIVERIHRKELAKMEGKPYHHIVRGEE